MSILDDAIREHLELKRSHGADDQELKRLEDEAFGPPQRPDEVDPFAEAPTEFLSQPGEVAAGMPEIGDEDERDGRRPNITDLQESPADSGFFDAEAIDLPVPEDAAPPAPAQDELSPAPDAPPPAPSAAADVPLPPPPAGAPADLAPPAPEPVAEAPTPGPEAAAPEVPAAAAPEAPALDAPAAEEPAAAAPEAPAPPSAEEPPAAAPEIVADHGPDTEERHEIADQPTQMFDVQAHVEAEAAAAESHELPSPTDEELVDAAQDEPHAAPPAPANAAAPFVPPTDEEEAEEHPSLFAPETGEGEQPPLETRGPDAEVAGHPPTEEESAEFDFFNEQRLSDELDQALEAPTASEREVPQYEEGAAEGGGAIFDFESEGAYEEDPSEEVLHRHDAREAESDEAPLDATVEQPRPNFDPPSEEEPRADATAEPPSEEADYAFDPDTGHEDVLEDTPRFLENAPEDDDLWFEQKPPKDFDLD
jgi:hypothetical protein